MDLDIRDTHALHLAMAGAEYEYCPFMFWYPPAVCYYKHWGPQGDEDNTNGDASADGKDIADYVADSSSSTTSSKASAMASPLLSLPPEVRLRIYYWAYMMSPIQPKELAAGYPIPMLCRYILHPLDPSLERQVEQEVENERVIVDLATADPHPGDGKGGEADGAREEEQTPAVQEQNELQRAIATERMIKERLKDRMRELNRRMRGLLSSERPLSGIPTGLLCACRQIYFEARTLPFENNEFVFLNWFSSGLNAASAVTKSQRSWQRLAMRYVRMEIMAEDLARVGALKKWADLCGGSDERRESWTRGLRGLRLKIVGQVGRKHTENAQEVEDKYVDGLEEEGGARRWVEGGKLAEMKNLERLEIEIIKNAWGTPEKMAWCAEVEAALREFGSRAEVVSMARIV